MRILRRAARKRLRPQTAVSSMMLGWVGTAICCAVGSATRRRYAHSSSATRTHRMPKPTTGTSFAGHVGHWVLMVESPISRSEEHTSELQSLMRISYAVFCLQKKKIKTTTRQTIQKH